MASQLISATRALTPDGDLGPYWVRVEEGRIVEVGHGAPGCKPDLHVDSGVLTPGFVDVHSHGGGGAAFDDGPTAARKVLRTHRQRGTTTMMASLVTDSIPRMTEKTEALRPLVETGELAGIHLEGPWLSPQQRGAHPEALLETPSRTDLEESVRSGLVRMITLAPEVPGGIDAVRHIVHSGAVAAIGHSHADYEEASEALEAGASVGTHLFNAMREINHRQPGIIEALLERPHAFLELICDGIHVNPAMVRLVFTHWAERVVLISDAMAAAAHTDGEYALGGLNVRVREGIAEVVNADGTIGPLAGSTLTLSAAVRCAVQQAEVRLDHALRAATHNPARMLGMEDVGSLRPGTHADLVLLSRDLRIDRVMHRGEWC